MGKKARAKRERQGGAEDGIPGSQQEETCDLGDLARSAFLTRLANSLFPYRSYLSYRVLFLVNAVLVAAGYAIIGYMRGQPVSVQKNNLLAIIEMGNMVLILLLLYFSATELLLRKRPDGARMLQRFVWYCTMILVILFVGVLNASYV
ncbi:MAG: hypothetical protein LBK01_01475 [Burkholderiaceae bacterium]|jgi:hypothetical protein|nr:hypothetical protein [Burkholderiaceae bacterium]